MDRHRLHAQVAQRHIVDAMPPVWRPSPAYRTVPSLRVLLKLPGQPSPASSMLSNSFLFLLAGNAG
jgi:hypothetical protein